MATQVPGSSPQAPDHRAGPGGSDHRAGRSRSEPRVVRQQAAGGDEDTIGWAWWAGTREFTIPWEERATVRLRVRGLRLPAPDDPAPDTGRMLGVCACAAVLSLAGLVVAGRALVSLLAGGTPEWYGPTMVASGLAGIALTGAAFLAVHHARLPWVLLGAGTVPLAVAAVGTVVAR